MSEVTISFRPLLALATFAILSAANLTIKFNGVDRVLSLSPPVAGLIAVLVFIEVEIPLLTRSLKFSANPNKGSNNE